MRPLNLASRPFRNERLGEALFALGAAALLAVTVWHALVIRDLLPARTSGLHREVAALDAELEALRKEAASRPTETPPAPVLAQWALVKELVDRRTFSWAGLFASLEGVVPDDVRLTSISPTVRKGEVEIEVSAMVREPAAGWEFVRALQAHDEFHDVFPTSEADREFRYKLRYRPRPPVEPAGPPEPPATTTAAATVPGGAPSPGPSPAGGAAPSPAPSAGVAAASPTPPSPPAGAAPSAEPAPVAGAGAPAARRGGFRARRLSPAGATGGRE